ncbi:MAG: OmpA family protein [Planctomycetota bacterium]|nr:OmpA family protein [Planctomycetota bacterium]
MKSLLLTALSGMMSFSLVGCNSNVKTENDLLKKENEELRAQYQDATNALEASDNDNTRLNNDLRSAQENAATLEEQLANQPETINIFEDINGVDVSMRDKDLALTVASDLLFNSGSTTLKTNAKSTLNEVANALNTNFPNKTIVIMGYTDTDQIKKSNFKSNWHLAFDRAWAVRDYLVTKGVSKNNIAIESWGPTKPLATKKESRRVDIVVVDN